MSVEIDWDRLLEDSENLSESMRSFLDTQFQKLPLPPYIKSLSVTSFSFGTIPPEITIKHITDPFPEFYTSEDDETTGEQTSYSQGSRNHHSNGHHNNHNHSHSHRPSNAPPPPPTPHPPESVRSNSTSLPSYSAEDPAATTNDTNPFFSTTPPPPLSPNSAPHYFHYPFGSNLLSTIRSPLYQSLQSLPSFGAMPIRPSSTSSASSTQAETNINPTTTVVEEEEGEQQPNNNDESSGSSSGATPDGNDNTNNNNNIKNDEDIQFFLDVAYKGDVKLGVDATLLLNYPSPSFVSLPMKLIVTGLEVHSMAVLTYISRRIHFSFICDVDGEGDAVTLAGHDRIDIIKDIKIESEIGDQEGQGPVLRNVGKVEKFLLERIRALIRDELAWPGWITFEF